jgi:hypothetical protein
MSSIAGTDDSAISQANPEPRLCEYSIMDALVQVFDTIHEEMKEYDDVTMEKDTFYDLLCYSLLQSIFPDIYKILKDRDYLETCFYHVCLCQAEQLRIPSVVRNSEYYDFAQDLLNYLVDKDHQNLVAFHQRKIEFHQNHGSQCAFGFTIGSKQAIPYRPMNTSDDSKYKARCVQHEEWVLVFIKFYTKIAERLYEERQKKVH